MNGWEFKRFARGQSERDDPKDIAEFFAMLILLLTIGFFVSAIVPENEQTTAESATQPQAEAPVAK